MVTQRENKENPEEQDKNNAGLQNELKNTQNCTELLHSHMKKLLSSKDRLKAQYEAEIEQLQSQLNELSEKLKFEQQLSKDVQDEIILLYQQKKETEGLHERLIAEQHHGKELCQELNELQVFQTDLIQQHNAEQDQTKRELQCLQDALDAECKRGDNLNDQLQNVLKEKEELDKHYKEVVDALKQEKGVISDAHYAELLKRQQALDQLTQCKNLIDALEQERVAVSDAHVGEIEEIRQTLEQQNKYKELVVTLTQEKEAICAAHFKELAKMREELEQLNQFKDLMNTLRQEKEKKSHEYNKTLEHMEEQIQSQDLVETLQLEKKAMHDAHYKELKKMQDAFDQLTHGKNLIDALEQERVTMSDAHVKEIEEIRQKLEQQNQYKELKLTKEKEMICSLHYGEHGKMREELEQLNQFKENDLVNTLKQEKEKMSDENNKKLEQMDEQIQYQDLVETFQLENKAICDVPHKELGKMQQDQLTLYNDLVVVGQVKKMSDTYHNELDESVEKHNQCSDIAEAFKQENDMMHHVHSEELDEMQLPLKQLNECKDFEHFLRQEKEKKSDDYEEVEKMQHNLDQLNHYKEIIEIFKHENEAMNDAQYIQIEKMQQQLEQWNKSHFVHTLRQEKEKMSDEHDKELDLLEEQIQYKDFVQIFQQENEATCNAHNEEIYKMQQALDDQSLCNYLVAEQVKTMSDTYYNELDESGEKLEQQNQCGDMAEIFEQENEVMYQVNSKEINEMQLALKQLNECKDFEHSRRQDKEKMSDEHGEEVEEMQPNQEQQKYYEEIRETSNRENEGMNDAKYNQLDSIQQELIQLNKSQYSVNKLMQENETMDLEHDRELEELQQEVGKWNLLRQENELMHGKERGKTVQKLELLSNYIDEVEELRLDQAEMCSMDYKKIELLQQDIVQPLKNEPQLMTGEWASSCIIHRTEIELLVGDGTWGCIREAMFRGQRVAVQCIHKAKITQNVHHELSTRAHVYHPNLVTFIAAVLDDQDGPMIITELLDMTLRKAYKDNILGHDLSLCISIFQDIALALRYLHELAAPIIHMGITSSNVFLEARSNGQWRAKLSNFGCSNWVKHSVAVADGSIVYIAPEAYPINPSQPQKQQTSKIDVYSYGILLCEVTIREIPDFLAMTKAHDSMKMTSEPLFELTMRCTQYEPDLRPAMASVLQDLYAISTSE